MAERVPGSGETEPALAGALPHRRRARADGIGNPERGGPHHLAHRKPGGETGKAARVIPIGVRQEDGVDRRHAEGRERRRHHSGSLIETAGRVIPGIDDRGIERWPGKSEPVDRAPATVEEDERAVALADIEKNDLDPGHGLPPAARGNSADEAGGEDER